MIARFQSLMEHSAALALLFLVWWYFSGPLGMPNYLLPSPATVFTTLLDMTLSGELVPHLFFTIRSIVLGLAFGTVVGVVLAYGLYKAPILSSYIEGPLVVLQTAPKIALAPLIIIWFGLGLTAKIVLVFSLVFFPVFAGTLAGLRSIDNRVHDLTRMLNLGRWDTFWQVDIPSAMPSIFVGIKIGAIQALVGAILAEWMSGADGLGYLMTFATATFQTSLLFSAVLLTAVLGMLQHGVLNAVETRFLSWASHDG